MKFDAATHTGISASNRSFHAANESIKILESGRELIYQYA